MDPKFPIGSFCYLITDPEQAKRMVTGISLRPGNTLYLLTSGSSPETAHYEMEISESKTAQNGNTAGFRKDAP